MYSRAPLAVGQLGEPVPHELLGLADQLLGHGLDDVGAVVGVQLEHPLLRDVVRRELRLEVELRHAGSRTMFRNVSSVAPHPAALDQLQTLRLEALLVVVARARREAAGSIAPMSVTWTKFAAKPVRRPSKWIGEIR